MLSANCALRRPLSLHTVVYRPCRCAVSKEPPGGPSGNPRTTRRGKSKCISGKRGTAKWLHQHGLGRFAVKEYTLDWLLSPAGAAAFPVVLKPVVGFGGRGVQIVRSVAALRQALRGRDPSEYILQEAITSPDEWGVYFVAHGGELLHAVCKRFAFNDSLFVRSGGIFGEGLQEQGVRPCDASPFGEDPLRNLVARARYHGFGTLGLKARAVGEPAALIEMNARVGYSMMMMLPALLEQVQRLSLIHI